MTFGRRRGVLRGAGVAVVAGLSGCISGGGGGSDDNPEGTYDVVVENAISKSDLRSSPSFDTSKKAAVSVEVDRVTGGENELLFERTLELGSGEKRTFEAAVETERDDSTYAANVVLEPFHEAFGRSRDGFQFTPGGERTPDDGSIDVTVYDDEEGSTLVSKVELERDTSLDPASDDRT